MSKQTLTEQLRDYYNEEISCLNEAKTDLNNIQHDEDGVPDISYIESLLDKTEDKLDGIESLISDIENKVEEIKDELEEVY